MAGAEAKEMKAELKVNAWDQMKPDQVKWYKETFAKNKKVQVFSYATKAKLDPREWDPNKLQKSISTLVRYEAVLFASRTADWMKQIEKAKDSDKATADCMKKLPHYFSEIHKKMTLKVDKALGELSSDKGDNKGAIEQGKKIFDKFGEIDAKTLFEEPIDSMMSLLRDFKKNYEKAEKKHEADEEKKKNDAQTKKQEYKRDESDRSYLDGIYSSALSAVKGIESGVKTKAKSTATVVKAVNAEAAKLTKDAKADPKLKAVGVEVIKMKGDMKSIVADLAKFQGDLKTFYDAVYKETMTPADASKWESYFKSAATRYSAATNAKSMIKTTKKKYEAVAKKLK